MIRLVWSRILWVYIGLASALSLKTDEHVVVEKYVWFQSVLPSDQPCCTLDTLREYIHRYNHRHTFLIKELEGKVAQELSDRKKQTKSTRHNRTLSADAHKLHALQRLVQDAEQQFKQGLGSLLLGVCRNVADRAT